MTAVEWLFEQLDISQGYESAIEILEQAKEMEKEQHTLIWYNGWSDRHLSLLHENKQNNLNKSK
jgi:hypothetical protein